MLADGLARGGPERRAAAARRVLARRQLRRQPADLQRGVVERLFAFAAAARARCRGSALCRGFWSPYDLNPLNINPLKDLIERFVDFERIRAGDRDLFISATNVLHRRAARVHARARSRAEVVMASACLPLLFRAVEIDGVPYWDGGYSGNPALLPFLRIGPRPRTC